MKNKESIRILVERGNELFRIGRSLDAIPYFARALIDAGALRLVACYVMKYRDIGWIKIGMLDELLKDKYNIDLADGALSLILDSTLSQIISLERVNDYQCFKRIFQGKDLRTVEDYADVLLSFFGEDYLGKTGFFHNLCYDKGFRLDDCEILALLRKRKKKIKLDSFERSLLDERSKRTGNIDNMTGLEFEEFLAEFFKTCGYIVTKTKTGNDYGADLILERFGERTVVQVKRHKRSIGVKAVQEVTAARNYYGAHKALAIISSIFTKNAKELAKSNSIELWDRKRLMQEIKKNPFM